MRMLISFNAYCKKLMMLLLKINITKMLHVNNIRFSNPSEERERVIYRFEYRYNHCKTECCSGASAAQSVTGTITIEQ